MRIVFIGTGDIGVPTLQALLKSEHEVVGVVTQPDKPVGRAQLIEPPPIKTALATTNIPILQPSRIKVRQAIEVIRALEPDVIVVMAYGQILSRDILEIPKLACLNLHASLFQLLQILSVTMFERTPLNQLLALKPVDPVMLLSDNQLNLFEF